MTDLDRARSLFSESGLAFPTIPPELAACLKERGEWCFSTRELSVSTYELEHYVLEASRVPVGDYAVLAHAGYGVNSYAIQYYLVRGSLRMFLHVAWGGVYSDMAKRTAVVRDCLSLADQIVAAAESRLGVGDQLTVVASTFYGGYWSATGEILERNSWRDVREIQLLSEALDWLRGVPL